MRRPAPANVRIPSASNARSAPSGTRQGQRGGRVEDVVLAGEGRLEARAEQAECRTGRRELEIRRRSLAARPVADDAPVPARQASRELLGTGVVDASSRSLPPRASWPPMPRTKRSNEAHHRLGIGEVVGVVHLDVRDDRAGGVVVEEVVAELVGLDKERRSCTWADRCAPRTDERADLDGGVQSGRDEQMAEQRGGGRLAMRAGHAQPDAPRRLHQLAEQRLPGVDCHATGLGRRELGVVRERREGPGVMATRSTPSRCPGSCPTDQGMPAASSAGV